jgi:hypothetical protein
MTKVDPNKEDFYDDSGQHLINVHSSTECSGSCTIHRHSKHTLDDKPLFWRNDRKIFEHICDHGIGHPCPDSLKNDDGIHGCDSCCSGGFDES